MCSRASDLSFVLSVSFCVLFVSLCAASDGGSIPDGSVKKSLSRDCDAAYSLTCFKLDIIGYLEKMSSTDEYDIVSGVSVVKENDLSEKSEDIVADMARSFPNDPEKRLDGYIIAKITSYLQSHVLRLKFLDDTTAESTRSAFTARKSKIGKKGGLEALLAAAMMMKGTLGALALGALAMIAGKALLTGLMALMLSAIVGLKSLTSGGGGGKATYEIVAKPMYSHSQSHSVSHDDHSHAGHTGYGSGYGRSINFVLPEHLTKE